MVNPRAYPAPRRQRLYSQQTCFCEVGNVSLAGKRLAPALCASLAMLALACSSHVPAPATPTPSPTPVVPPPTIWRGTTAAQPRSTPPTVAVQSSAPTSTPQLPTLIWGDPIDL